MAKKINANTVLKMASRNNEDLDLNSIELEIDEFSIDDLVLKEDESNIENYNKLNTILNTASTCQVSDAYNTLYRKTGVVKGLKSLNGHSTYGKIITVHTPVEDWGTAVAGIDIGKKGEVLFIESEEGPLAVWGELASTCAKEQGLAGVAVYGKMRDIDILKHMDYPLFCVDTCPNAGTALGYGKLNVELNIDNDPIKPGDFFYGDENGVVVIPEEKFNEVILQTLAIKRKEAGILKALSEGKTLAEIAGVKDQLIN
jgi:3-hexulose-6-phosphate synthase